MRPLLIYPEPYAFVLMTVNDSVMWILNIYVSIKVIFHTKLLTYYFVLLPRNVFTWYIKHYFSKFSNAIFKKLLRDGQKRMTYLKLAYQKT
jgi:hypothetical protein